jgi:hypothetical protein
MICAGARPGWDIAVPAEPTLSVDKPAVKALALVGIGLGVVRREERLERRDAMLGQRRTGGAAYVVQVTADSGSGSYAK